MRTYSYCVVDVSRKRRWKKTRSPSSRTPPPRRADDAADCARIQSLGNRVYLSQRPPGCALRFRIFTPTMEMRFAGHPTIGGAFVALDRGLIPTGSAGFLVEELVGDVPVRVERGARPTGLTTPPIEFGRSSTATPARALSACPKATSRPRRRSSFLPGIRTSTSRCGILQASTVRARSGRRAPFARRQAKRGLRLRLRRDGNGRVFAHVRPGARRRRRCATGSATGPLAAYMMRYD